MYLRPPCYGYLYCLFDNTRDTSVMHEKVMCVCFIDMKPQIKRNANLSNKHESGLVVLMNRPNKTDSAVSDGLDIILRLFCVTFFTN